MKNKHAKIVRSDEDFRVFITECFCRTPKQHPTTIEEAKDWCYRISPDSNEAFWPKKYPCFAYFSDVVQADDNVGFGFRHIMEMSFEYIEELQKTVNEASEKINKLIS